MEVLNPLDSHERMKHRGAMQSVGNVEQANATRCADVYAARYADGLLINRNEQASLPACVDTPCSSFIDVFV